MTASSRARTVFLLCFRAAPGRSTALIACQLAANLATLAGAYSIKLVTDAALRGDRAGVVVAAVVMAGMGLAAVLFGRGYLLLTTSVSEQAGRHVDSELIRLAGSIPTIEHYERPHYADQLTLIRQERTALAGMLNASVLNLRVAVSLIGAIAILATINPILLALPVLGVPALLANQRASAIATKAREASAPSTRLRNHLYAVASAPASGQEIRVFGLVDELLARHERVSDELEHTATRAALRGLARTGAASVIFAAGYAGALLVVLLAAIHGQVTAGTLVLTITLAALLNSQLATAAQYTSYFQRVLSAAGRLIWLRQHTAQYPTDLAAPPTDLRTGISLDAVGFSYPETDREALTDITAHIPAGSVVAVVGENGSGKTTLVKLLSALYQPTSGTIRADDADLAGIDPAGWQQRISPAFQDFVRFEFTLGESVGVGDLPRIADEPAITAALARAGAADLAESGLTSQLGTGGTELSGGQWQKVALGRALMREQPLLRVFDEPTASLDAVTEQAIFRRIATATRAQARRPTTILVSHRFATATMADQILVLDQGRIIERGDHKALVEAGGRYAELYELQTRAYR
ncbi:MAG TPA: ABC transporter ATP-binding protein [Pseudonocardiaceae bacterium]|jgi:ABC-type multidrug transport system fused ATPase/permease subunit|nr:ABC transporter ATP-binding protein [Pseudonocardiaceae bacterium]